MSDIRFEGGPEVLKPVEEAEDVYEALGLWWAKIVLKARPDIGVGDKPEGAGDIKLSLAFSALRDLEFIKPKIGGFAKAVEHVAREAGWRAEFIRSDYGPDEHLTRAAELADMPWDRLTTFPTHASTGIRYEGRDPVLIALLDGEAEQVWPPVQ